VAHIGSRVGNRAVAVDALADQEFASITGPAAEGNPCSPSVPTRVNNRTAKAIVDRFQANNIDPEGYTSLTYAAMHVCVDKGPPPRGRRRPAPPKTPPEKKRRSWRPSSPAPGIPSRQDEFDAKAYISSSTMFVYKLYSKALARSIRKVLRPSLLKIPATPLPCRGVFFSATFSTRKTNAAPGSRLGNFFSGTLETKTTEWFEASVRLGSHVFDFAASPAVPPAICRWKRRVLWRKVAIKPHSDSLRLPPRGDTISYLCPWSITRPSGPPR